MRRYWISGEGYTYIREANHGEWCKYERAQRLYKMAIGGLEELGTLVEPGVAALVREKIVALKKEWHDIQ
jgi:hypothetical protein